MHSFLTEEGSREARVVKTLVNIGPAVLNGGCSTFLAFILLATSKSHVFLSFFKEWSIFTIYHIHLDYHGHWINIHIKSYWMELLYIFTIGQVNRLYGTIYGWISI